jgi:site-specific DNA recombinase
MLESAAEGKFDYIITKSAKRVSRNTVELLQIMRYLKERGIQRKFEEGLFSSYKYFMVYRCVEGELVIVPEQAKIVELIFELYSKGYTFSQIKNTWRKVV